MPLCKLLCSDGIVETDLYDLVGHSTLIRTMLEDLPAKETATPLPLPAAFSRSDVSFFLSHLRPPSVLCCRHLTETQTRILETLADFFEVSWMLKTLQEHRKNAPPLLPLYKLLCSDGIIETDLYALLGHSTLVQTIFKNIPIGETSTPLALPKASRQHDVRLFLSYVHPASVLRCGNLSKFEMNSLQNLANFFEVPWMLKAIKENRERGPYFDTVYAPSKCFHCGAWAGDTYWFCFACRDETTNDRDRCGRCRGSDTMCSISVCDRCAEATTKCVACGESVKESTFVVQWCRRCKKVVREGKLRGCPTCPYGTQPRDVPCCRSCATLWILVQKGMNSVT